MPSGMGKMQDIVDVEMQTDLGAIGCLHVWVGVVDGEVIPLLAKLAH